MLSLPAMFLVLYWCKLCTLPEIRWPSTDSLADLPWDDITVSLLLFDCMPCLGLLEYLWIMVPKAAVLTNFCFSCFETGDRLCLLLVMS